MAIDERCLLSFAYPTLVNSTALLYSLCDGVFAWGERGGGTARYIYEHSSEAGLPTLRPCFLLPSNLVSEYVEIGEQV